MYSSSANEQEGLEDKGGWVRVWTCIRLILEGREGGVKGSRKHNEYLFWRKDEGGCTGLPPGF